MTSDSLSSESSVPDSLDSLVEKVSKSMIGRFASRVEASRIPVVSTVGRLFLQAQYGFYFPGTFQEKFCDTFGYDSLRLTRVSLAEGVLLNGFRGAVYLAGYSEQAREFATRHTVEGFLEVGTGVVGVYTVLSVGEYGLRGAYAFIKRKPIGGIVMEVMHPMARKFINALEDIVRKKKEDSRTKQCTTEDHTSPPVSTPSQQSLYNDDFFL